MRERLCTSRLPWRGSCTGRSKIGLIGKVGWFSLKEVKSRVKVPLWQTREGYPGEDLAVCATFLVLALLCDFSSRSNSMDQALLV